MLLRIGNEAEDRMQRPGQYTSLLTRKALQYLRESFKTVLRRTKTVNIIIQAFRKCTCSSRRAHRIPQRHFLKRKKQVGPRFYSDRMAHDLRFLSLVQQLTEFWL